MEEKMTNEACCSANGECICYQTSECTCEVECECEQCEEMNFYLIMKDGGCPCGGNCSCGQVTYE